MGDMPFRGPGVRLLPQRGPRLFAFGFRPGFRCELRVSLSDELANDVRLREASGFRELLHHRDLVLGHPHVEELLTFNHAVPIRVMQSALYVKPQSSRRGTCGPGPWACTTLIVAHGGLERERICRLPQPHRSSV